MHPHFARLAAIFLVALTASTALAGPIPANKPAHYPDWWFERDVIVRLPAAANKPDPIWPADYPIADDYAAANIGQLKSMAYGASQYLYFQFPGGAGSEINAMIAAWSQPPAATRDDYAALNLGQLKFVAAPFHTRLGLAYPWTSDSADDDDYGLVNIGQLKHVFAFQIVDLDADGLSDIWEIGLFGSLNAQTGTGNPDADPYDNYTEQLLGTNPLSPASSSTPTGLGLIIFSP